MSMPQRILLFIATTSILSLILLTTLYQTKQVPSRRPPVPELLLNSWLSAFNATSAPHNISTLVKDPSLAAVSKHPSTTLVLATLSTTDNSWIGAELGDLLGPSSNLYTAVYVVDDERAPLHTPANKGHEAMAYLTYLIDFYENLPEISIFMHGHPEAWHNNFLLSMSSSETVRNLDRSKVMRDGYFNLRCHWRPGCQPGINPAATKYNKDRPEELVIAEAWQTLFPLHDVPEILAQPCCSQFALSREAIHAHPVERYVQFRDWLLESRLSDYLTGRVFEYFWHWIFKGVTTLCPDPRMCYCEGYGACFEDPDDYGKFFELVAQLGVYRKEMRSWAKWADDKTIERRDEVDSDKAQSEPGPDLAHQDTLAQAIWRPGRKNIAGVAASADAEHASKYGLAMPWSPARAGGKSRSTQRRQRSIDVSALESSQNVTVEDGPDPVEVGQAGREAWLESKIYGLIEKLDEMKAAAFETGKDSTRKEVALEATRNLTNS